MRMKNLSKLAVILAVVPALAACDNFGGAGPAANQAANGAAGANAVDSAGGKDTGNGAAPAAAAGATQVNRAFLIGRWTDNGDCNNTITFNADGTFTVPGGGSGLWVLDGDSLTFQGGAGNRTARVQAPDSNTIMLIQQDGSIGRSTRCT